jgi:hypothetical protein
MSTTIISIGGGYNATNSLVPVASKFSTSISGAIQAYVNTNISGPVEASTLNLEDNEVVTPQDFKFGSASAGVYEITNTDSSGNVFVGPPQGNPYTVTGGSTAFVAQEGGNYSVTGAPSTTFALIGAYSNVDYTVTNPDAGSIYAAGGSNVININYNSGVAGPQNAETVYSAGNDTINLNGLGFDSVIAESGSDDLVQILSGTATVTADGNATVAVTFAEHAGGNLDFINNSTTSQTVFSGAYTQQGGGSVFAPNSVTAFGGAGGGYFVGGLAGNNSLIGGSGVVTLQGGGAGDVLSVTGGGGSQNVLFSGNGTETLVASSTTGSNLLQLGGPYTGKGDVTTSGSASALGSGFQTFFIGNVANETITGSAIAQQNIYDVIGDSTAGGGSFTVTDFGTFPNSVMYLVGADGLEAGDASVSVIGSNLGGSAQILLTDGTTITLKGVQAANVHTTTTGPSIQAIYVS